MPYKFTPYLHTNQSYYGPKGNLSSWEHANRLFVDNNMEFAPKVAFLYHVSFVINPAARSLLPSTFATSGLGVNEIGLLAKTATLPKFQPQVETLNRYNQKKNIQTKIVYDPVTIQLHDDKKSLTSSLLQAYYKYYFVDGNYSARPSGYNPNNTYSSGLSRYGLDARIPQKHFFKEIHISQLSRGVYNRYTLVNPILSKFDHDDLDYSDGNKALANTITIQYEAVFTSAGKVTEGSPDSFGEIRYDKKPSSLNTNLLQTDYDNLESGNTFDIEDERYKNRTTENNFLNKLTQDHMRNVFDNRSYEGYRRNNFSTTQPLKNKSANISGIQNLLFAKTSNNFLDSEAKLKSKTNQVVNNSISRLQQNPALLESARKVLYRKEFQSNGNAGSISEADAEYELRKNDKNFISNLDNKLGL